MPGADGEGLGSTLKSFLSYTCGIWATQKIFDRIAQEFVFKAGNNKRGVQGRECELLWVPSNKNSQTPWISRARISKSALGFFVNVKHNYKAHFIFCIFFSVSLWKNAARIKINFLIQIPLEFYQKF